MNAKSWSIAVVILAAPVGVSPAQPVPILQYRFNGSGTTASSSGSTAEIVNLRDANNQPSDLHRPNGVSGVTDTAFLLDATGMGRNNNGGVAIGPHVPAITGMTSFTLQGWFKTRTNLEAFGNQARLYQSDFGVLGAPNNSTGVMRLDVFDAAGSGAITAPSNAAFSATTTWMFFAATFDGTSVTGNNLNYYVGSTSSAVTSAGSSRVGADGTPFGPTFTGSASFLMGDNGAVGSVPMDGFLDDMRIFGSTTDASGVLTQSQLEAIRGTDIVPVPEPGTLALTALTGLTFIFRHPVHKRPSAISSLRHRFLSRPRSECGA